MNAAERTTLSGTVARAGERGATGFRPELDRGQWVVAFTGANGQTYQIAHTGRACDQAEADATAIAVALNAVPGLLDDLDGAERARVAYVRDRDDALEAAHRAVRRGNELLAALQRYEAGYIGNDLAREAIAEAGAAR